MRLESLGDLSRIPTDRIQLPKREVLAALPAHSDDPPADAVLLATLDVLIVVTREDGSDGPTLATDGIGWDGVRLAADEMVLPGTELEDDQGPFHLAVATRERVYHAMLAGLEGKAALRDFVIAEQRGAGDA